MFVHLVECWLMCRAQKPGLFGINPVTRWAQQRMFVTKDQIERMITEPGIPERLDEGSKFCSIVVRRRTCPSRFWNSFGLYRKVTGRRVRCRRVFTRAVTFRTHSLQPQRCTEEHIEPKWLKANPNQPVTGSSITNQRRENHL